MPPDPNHPPDATVDSAPQSNQGYGYTADVLIAAADAFR